MCVALSLASQVAPDGVRCRSVAFCADGATVSAQLKKVRTDYSCRPCASEFSRPHSQPIIPTLARLGAAGNALVSPEILAVTWQCGAGHVWSTYERLFWSEPNHVTRIQPVRSAPLLGLRPP